MKGAIAWFAGNPVAANLVLLIIVAGGLVSTCNIKQEVFPEVDLDEVFNLTELIDAINSHEDNGGKVTASLSNGQLVLTDSTGGGGSLTVEDINGAAVVEGVDFTVDTKTGEVTFTTAPAAGLSVTAGFEFDVPVRFDTDRIQTSVASFQAGDVPSVPVVVRLNSAFSRATVRPRTSATVSVTSSSGASRR